MPELDFRLLDETTFDQIPSPMQAGARCQTCDYWERLDGRREPPPTVARDAEARAALKRFRLQGDAARGGSLAMLAFDAAARKAEPEALGYAQFGPLSAYQRAQTIRERYPELPESPAPWVVTCLQVPPSTPEDARAEMGTALLQAVCDELDGRGITAVEAYPESIGEAWLSSPGPASVYEAAGFSRAAGDDRYPVYRRELSGETDADAWSDLLRAAAPADEDEGWPLPLPSNPDADDFFRLPPEKPKRPNPFGED